MLGEGGGWQCSESCRVHPYNDLPAGRFIQASVFMLW